MTLHRGILAALAAAVLFGLSTPLAKTLTGSASPLLLSGMLYAGSGAGLALVLLVRQRRASARPLLWPRGRDLLWFTGAIASGGAIGPFLLMTGLRQTDAATASLALNLEAVFTALIAWFVFRENVDRRVALGMALIVAGGIALSGGIASAAGSASGSLALAGACLAWAIDNNLTRRISGYDAVLIAGVKGLVAGSCSIALALAFGEAAPAARTTLLAALIGFMGYGLSLSCFVLALRSLGTARTSAYFSVAPFVGAAFAVALGAPMSATLAIGGVLMAAGVALHLTEHHEHRHRHAYVRHEHEHTHDVHHGHAHDTGEAAAARHSHVHEHAPMEHAHPHYPDSEHRHQH